LNFSVKEENEVCGGVLTGPEGNLTSPNYPNPYPHNAYCVWNITVPSGDITLTVTELDVESCSSNDYDFLKVFASFMSCQIGFISLKCFFILVQYI